MHQLSCRRARPERTALQARADQILKVTHTQYGQYSAVRVNLQRVYCGRTPRLSCATGLQGAKGAKGDKGKKGGQGPIGRSGEYKVCFWPTSICYYILLHTVYATTLLDMK